MPHHRLKTNAHGFTLLELSMVVIIIGVIASGIFVGRDLMKAAAIRKAVSQIQELQTGVTAFQEKYQALPGDFGQAYEYWPDALPEEGDNDGRIEGAGADLEDYNVWNHMNLAGLVNGSYQPVAAEPTAGDISVGYPSPLEGVYVHMAYEQPVMSSNVVRAGNYLTLYKSPTGSSYSDFVNYAIPHVFPAPDQFSYGLWPEDAQYIDTKIDDGLPFTGKVFAIADVIPALGDQANCPVITGDNLYNTNKKTTRGICGLWVELK